MGCPRSSASESKDESAYRHADCCKMLAIVIPCSRKRVRIRSASVLSSWRSRLTVSRILMIWDRRDALFVEGFEPRLPFKLDVGELALQLFHFVSNLFLNFGVVRFGQFSAFPGQVLFRLRISGRRCWRARPSLSSWPPSSQPDLCGLGDPGHVNLRIINGLQCGFDVFYALTCGISHAGEVLQLDGFNVFREGFLCTLECLHGLSAEPPRYPRSIISEPQRSPQCICAASPVSSGQCV